METLQITITAKDGTSTVFQKIGASAKAAGTSIQSAGTQGAAGLGKVDQAATKSATSLKTVDTSAKQTAASMKTVGDSATRVGAALGTLAAGAAKAGAAFANQQRQIAGIKAAYGDASDAILEMAENIQATTRFSNDAAREGALLASSLASNYELTAEQIGELVARSADLAQVFGTDLADAIQRTSSAIRGEGESAERLGLNMSDAAIAAKALEAGITNWGVPGALTEAEKAAFRFNILMGQTGAVTGQAAAFAETSAGGFAQLKNELQDTGQAVGGFLGDFGSLAAEFAPMALALPLISAGLGKLAVEAKIAGTALLATRAGMVGLAVATGPVGIAIAAVAVTAVALYSAYKQLTAVSDEIARSFEDVTTTLNDLNAAGESYAAGVLERATTEKQLAATLEETGNAYTQVAAKYAEAANSQVGWTTDLQAAFLDYAIVGEEVAEMNDAIVAAFNAEGAVAADVARYIDALRVAHEAGNLSGDQYLSMVQDLGDGVLSLSDYVEGGMRSQIEYGESLTATGEAAREMSDGVKTIAVTLGIAGQAARLTAQAEAILAAETEKAASAYGNYDEAMRASAQSSAEVLGAMREQREAAAAIANVLLGVLNPAFADTAAAMAALEASGANVGQLFADLFDAQELTNAATAMDSVLSVFTQIDALAQRSAAAESIATNLIGEPGVWAEIDQLLADGAIRVGEYNRAVEAGTSIQADNAAVQQDLNSIRAQQLPLLAEQQAAYAAYIDDLSRASTEEQQHALYLADSANAAKVASAAATVYSASLGEIPKEAATEIVANAAQADPILKDLLESYDLIEVGANGDIRVNFPDGETVQSTITELTESIDALIVTMGGVPPLHLEADDQASPALTAFSALVDKFAAGANDITVKTTATGAVESGAQLANVKIIASELDGAQANVAVSAGDVTGAEATLLSVKAVVTDLDGTVSTVTVDAQGAETAYDAAVRLKDQLIETTGQTYIVFINGDGQAVITEVDGLRAGISNVPATLPVDADRAPFDAGVAAIDGTTVGTAIVELQPNTEGIGAGGRFSEGFEAITVKVLVDDSAIDAFFGGLDGRLPGALEVAVTVDDSALQTLLARLPPDVTPLINVKVNLDTSALEQLDLGGDKAISVAVDVDAGGLTVLADQLDALSGYTVSPSVAVDVDTGGLPVLADQLDAIAGTSYDFTVQVDTSQAAEGVNEIVRVVNELSGSDATVTVTADAGSAALIIDAVATRLNELGGTTVTATLGATDNASPTVATAKANADAYATAAYVASLTATDSASGTIAVPQGNATAFAITYTANLAASDGASGVIGGAQGAATAFASTYTASLAANDGASGVIASVANSLAALDGSVATVTVNAVDNTGGVTRMHGGGIWPRIPTAAHGRVVHVGEAGPENVILPFGSQVQPAGASRSRNQAAAAPDNSAVRQAMDDLKAYQADVLADMERQNDQAFRAMERDGADSLQGLERTNAEVFRQMQRDGAASLRQLADDLEAELQRGMPDGITLNLADGIRDEKDQARAAAAELGDEVLAELQSHIKPETTFALGKEWAGGFWLGMLDEVPETIEAAAFLAQRALAAAQGPLDKAMARLAGTEAMLETARAIAEGTSAAFDDDPTRAAMREDVAARKRIAALEKEAEARTRTATDARQADARNEIDRARNAIHEAGDNEKRAAMARADLEAAQKRLKLLGNLEQAQRRAADAEGAAAEVAQLRIAGIEAAITELGVRQEAVAGELGVAYTDAAEQAKAATADAKASMIADIEQAADKMETAMSRAAGRIERDQERTAQGMERDYDRASRSIERDAQRTARIMERESEKASESMERDAQRTARIMEQESERASAAAERELAKIEAAATDAAATTEEAFSSSADSVASDSGSLAQQLIADINSTTSVMETDMASATDSMSSDLAEVSSDLDTLASDAVSAGDAAGTGLADGVADGTADASAEVRDLAKLIRDEIEQTFTAAIEGDSADLARAIIDAQSKIRDFLNDQMDAEFGADTTKLDQEINAIDGDTVGKVFMEVEYRDANRDKPSGGGKLHGGAVQGRKLGGTVWADRSPRSLNEMVPAAAMGRILQVGEAGPELALLPYGTMVVPHGAAQARQRADGGGQSTLVNYGSMNLHPANPNVHEQIRAAMMGESRP